MGLFNGGKARATRFWMFPFGSRRCRHNLSRRGEASRVADDLPMGGQSGQMQCSRVATGPLHQSLRSCGGAGLPRPRPHRAPSSPLSPYPDESFLRYQTTPSPFAPRCQKQKNGNRLPLQRPCTPLVCGTHPEFPIRDSIPQNPTPVSENPPRQTLARSTFQVMFHLPLLPPQSQFPPRPRPNSHQITNWILPSAS